MAENFLSAPAPDLATWFYAIAQDGTHLQVCLMGGQNNDAPAYTAYLVPSPGVVGTGGVSQQTQHNGIAANHTVTPQDSGTVIHNAPATAPVTVSVDGSTLLPGHHLEVHQMTPAASPQPISISFSANDVIHDGRTAAVINGPKIMAADALAAAAVIRFKLHSQSGGKSHWHVDHHVAGPHSSFA